LIPTLLIGLLLSLLPADTPASGQNQNLAQTRSPHGDLNIPCQNCHTAIGWKPIRAVPEFDHNKTKYPLRGMHENVACTQCHTKPVFTNVSTRCADCHADIHKRQMGANCEQCHTVKGWNVSMKSIQNHENRFPLIGAHAALECDDCHKGAAVGQFQGLSTQCYSCHAQSFQQATNPNHVASKFPTSCEQCHGMDTWLNAKFDHASTGFPLTGAHATVACDQCHVNGNYNLTSANSACVSCHLKDFQGTTNPNHVSGGFSQTCQQCHNTVSWSGATFNHATTGFPLTGAHATVACTQCHVNNNYNLTSTACVTCHLKDFQGASNPNHMQQGFAQTCESCHNTTAWQPASFNHAASGFPLTGAHATVACTQCHVNNNYNLTSTACVTCHLTDFQNTNNPAHPAAGFPTDCSICHSTTSWAGATFNHATTGFALTGAHTTLQCAQCHVNSNYNITSAACVNCHLNDFNTTNNPSHVSAGFPQTCDLCHDTTVWTDSTFNHNNTPFPLTGAHTTVACANCHVNNNYTTVPTDCYSCHKAQYMATTNPNHQAAGFPTTCATCHTTTAWTGATFNHTFFPLNHGGANGVCATCHINSSDYSVFQCTGCHGNNNAANFHHPSVGGYVYNSINCYQCHRGG
jgi:hypothetical protein